MPVTESEKVLARIWPLLEGKSVLDLGCGVKKIVPWATGVDDHSESKNIGEHHVAARVDAAAMELQKHFPMQSFAVVFSSHTLEHIAAPLLETLQYWGSFVAPAGRMILYLPNEDRYRFDPRNPSVKNPGHAHLLTPKSFHAVLEKLQGFTIETFSEDPEIYDHYSFLVVLAKS